MKSSEFPEGLFIVGMAPIGCFYFIINDDRDTSVYYADFEDADGNEDSIVQEALKSPEHKDLESFKNWILELESLPG